MTTQYQQQTMDYSPQATAPVPATQQGATPPAQAPGGDLVGTNHDRGIQTRSSRYTQEERDLIRALCGDDTVSDGDIDMLNQVANRSGLDPFLKEIYLVGRKTKTGGYRGEQERWETKWTVQTGIDGFRSTSKRYADARGEAMHISAPTFYDHQGNERKIWLKTWGYPAAAQVTVTIGKSSADHIVTWDEYAQVTANWEYDPQLKKRVKVGEKPNSMWEQLGPTMLAKCFTGDTEILTEKGFIRLDQFDNELVAQVTNSGLELVKADYLVQDYAGDMITSNADMLNFKVTPNHDMVTTFGKVEAGAMYATTTTRGPWRIPLTHLGAGADNADWSDADLRLAGYAIADGVVDGNHITMEVSRPYKIEELDKLDAVRTYVRHSRGATSTRGDREIRSNFDKAGYTFPLSRITPIVDQGKNIDVATALSLSPRQARILVDAWQLFDGHTNKTTNVRRLYTSRVDHLRALEVIAVHAGYSVNVARERTDIEGAQPNYYLTISEPDPIKVIKPRGNQPGVVIEQNDEDKVYCVTVPSGQIIVRRNGFSMVCGNCAEAGAHRRVCPVSAGMYVVEEMQQAVADEREFRRESLRVTAERQDVAQDAIGDVMAALNRPQASQEAPQDAETVEVTPEVDQATPEPQEAISVDADGYPVVTSHDPEEDLRVNQNIARIKITDTDDGLGQAHNALAGTFQGIHLEAFEQALRTRQLALSPQQ